MSELIRDVIYQKDSLVERLSKQTIEQVNSELKEPGPDFWIEMYNKKFAGLVVEECANEILKSSHREDDMVVVPDAYCIPYSKIHIQTFLRN